MKKVAADVAGEFQRRPLRRRHIPVATQTISTTRHAQAILAIAILAQAVGCASFSERPAMPGYPGPAQPAEVRLVGTQRSLLQIGDEWRDNPWSSTFLLDEATAAIWKSGWVRRSVRRSSNEDPPTIELNVVELQGAGPGLLSALTAFVIPGIIDHRIDIEMNLSRSDAPRRSCFRSVEMRTWYQTVLIFAYPLRSPTYGRVKATEALALACLAQLLEEAHV